MARVRDWLTVQIPEYFSAWLWRAFRRPRRFLLFLVILPLVIVGIVTHRVNVTLAQEQALQHLGVTARLAAAIVQETLEATLRAERILLAQPGFDSAVQRGDRQSITQHLEDALPFIPRVDLAVVMSPEGVIIAAYPDEVGLVGRDVADTDAFKGAKHRRQPYVSAVYLREGPQIEKVVGVVHPIEIGGTVVGLLQLQHRVEEVKSWLQKIRLDPEGFLYIVDHHQQLVVYPFQVLPGPPRVVRDWPTVRSALSADGGTLTFRDAQHRKQWLAGLFPVGRSGWRVVAVQPERAALRSVRRIFWTLSLLAGALMMLVIAISLRWAQLHAFSLRLLRQNAKLLKQLQQRRILAQAEQLARPKGELSG